MNRKNKKETTKENELLTAEMTETAEGETAEHSGKKKKQKKPANKKKLVKRCILGGVAVLVLGGIVYANVAAKNAKLPVATVAVIRGDIEESLSTSGTVKSEVSKSYFPPAEVAVRNLTVSLGDAVKKGDLLMEYNTEIAEYKQKQAALQAKSSSSGYAGQMYDSQVQEQKYTDAQNNLLNVEPMIYSQKEYIKQCESWLEDDISRKKVEIYHEQYKLQKEINSLSEEQALAASEGRKTGEGVLQSMEHAQNEQERLNLELKLLDEDTELTQVERAIVEQKNKLADLEEFKTKQESIRDSAETQVLNPYEKSRLSADNQLQKLALEEADKDLAEALNGVTADFNGIVTELSVQDGSLATPETAILKLESSDQVKVTFNVSKYDLEKIDLGQSAEVDISGHSYQGTVTKINRMATTGSSGTPVVGAEVHIENPDDYIYLGVEAKVKVNTNKSENALLIPIEVVGADKDGDFCYVIENETVVKKRLKTGIASDLYIEVLEGLSEGDQVITDTMNITEGMAVTAMLTEETTETGEQATEVSEDETAASQDAENAGTEE
ncbi:MAG: efflux RND transporter periplasmic adaptor subunit [Lachnospiraceae bacterium]|nr:efflux RND transporter periplasmic adaptor subunit [Lachnospiraceae bacterium]